jgi:hypothetical protein
MTGSPLQSWPPDDDFLECGRASKGLTLLDVEESALHEKAGMRQKRIGGPHFAATYPPAKNRRKHKLPIRKPLAPIIPGHGNQCEISCQHISNHLSDHSCTTRQGTPASKMDEARAVRPIIHRGEMQRSLLDETQEAQSPPVVQKDSEPTILHIMPDESAISDDICNLHTATTSRGIDKASPVPKQRNERFDSFWQRIRGLRELIWGMRLRLQQQRAILREKQYAKAVADDNYMKLVRLIQSVPFSELGDLKKDGKSLTQLFDVCEQTRAEYGPLEDDCNLLEDEIGSQELKLTNLEHEFTNRLTSFSTRNQEDMISELLSDVPSLESNSDMEEEFHPLVAEYLSKMGDVDILRERHEGHLDEKAAMESERETRRNVDLDLSPDDQLWLDGADEMEKEILEELRQAVDEAEQLKQKCLSEGLVHENGEPKDFQTQEQEAFDGDVDAKGQTSDFIKFPVLLPHSGTKHLSFRKSAPKPEEKSGSAGDHINQWLLHDLRSSPLAVNLLARTFEDEVGNIERDHWQSHVLDLWYRDGAIKGASGYRIYSTGATTRILDDTMPTQVGPSSGDKTEQVHGAFLTRSTSQSGSDSEIEMYEARLGNNLLLDPLPQAHIRQDRTRRFRLPDP